MVLSLIEGAARRRSVRRWRVSRIERPVVSGKWPSDAARCAAARNMPHKWAELRVAPPWPLWLLGTDQEHLDAAVARIKFRLAARQVERRFMALAARTIAALMWLAAGLGAAVAQDGGGGPLNWQMQSQTPATQVMDYITWFSWYTVVIMSLIVLLVVLLIAWCVYKYNERANPVPSRVTHHTLIEVLWTVLPVLILVAIAIPSFRLLYGQYDPSKLYENYDPENTQFLTVKVTGFQWYWGVEYGGDEDSIANGVPGPLTFDALMVPDADIDAGKDQLRNLSVDNPMIVPVDTFVRVQTTAGDVIHSFAVPAFGIKTDSVPGRLNETYFKAEREGTFYGQCSELCGKDHAFMPIEVRVVSQEQFRAWAQAAGTDLPGAYQTLARMIEADTQKEVAAR